MSAAPGVRPRRAGRGRSGVAVIAALAVLALAAAPLAACGKKGRLDPPPGKKIEYPKDYPRD